VNPPSSEYYTSLLYLKCYTSLIVINGGNAWINKFYKTIEGISLSGDTVQ